MYPGTIFEWEDRSVPSTISQTSVRTKPFYAATFTSDKGTEDWLEVEGEEFFKMYGNDISFSRHGQPLLQTAMSINWGAKVLAKRVVASDATLANLGVFAKVVATKVQKTDADGNLVYIDDEDNETTEVTGTIAEIDAAKITYTVKTVEDVVQTIDNNGKLLRARDTVYKAMAEETVTADEFLLFTIVDNGRGNSNKRFYIAPDYNVSKSYEFTMYNFALLENGNVLESVRFALDPDLIISNQNISLASMIRTRAKQVEAKQYDVNIEKFIDKVQELSGLTDSEIRSGDVMFGTTKKGVKYPTIVVDITSAGAVNLQHPYGQSLQSGSNGAFGAYPLEAASYGTEMAKAYTDDPTTVIYDVDRYKLDAVLDANYPAVVKRAIEELATFRQDFFYFRDMGLGLGSMEEILLAFKAVTKTQFSAPFHNSYDIVDPYSRKQIKVTFTYTLARLLVSHFNNGRNLPLAGQKFSMIADDAIPGTINFVPVIAPGYNQKEELGDLGINYLSYIGDQLVLETLYTSYDKVNSQFSYINNVLAIQEVVKAVRTRCPAIRYSFLSGEDLETYKKDVNEELAKYESNFDSLTMEYIEDEDYIANKIFYAAIKVVCKEFIHSEYFHVIAINRADLNS